MQLFYTKSLYVAKITRHKKCIFQLLILQFQQNFFIKSSNVTVITFSHKNVFFFIQGMPLCITFIVQTNKELVITVTCIYIVRYPCMVITLIVVISTPTEPEYRQCTFKSYIGTLLRELTYKTYWIC